MAKITYKQFDNYAERRWGEDYSKQPSATELGNIRSSFGKFTISANKKQIKIKQKIINKKMKVYIVRDVKFLKRDYEGSSNDTISPMIEKKLINKLLDGWSTVI